MPLAIRPLRALVLLLVALLGALPVMARAQSAYWVQVEAHATLRTAEDFAARYEARVGNVAGFRIAGGWYALALGPFETAADAEAVRRQLIALREIRADAYVTDGTIYGEQFWPAGAALRGAPPPVAAPAPAPVAVAPEPTPEPAPVPAPVTEPAPAPVTAAPQPAPEPDETPAEARAADQRLSRDERIEIQQLLEFFGFYTYRITGQFGPITRRSIEDWQRAMGHPPTGFLTSRQRRELSEGRAAALARFGSQTVRDELAGIEITLPLGMVEFDRHDAPFAHFREVAGSGLRVLLISQEGTQATMFGLYEILQTLEAIPPEGQRERRSSGFLITGRNDTARAHVEVHLERGQIKGWALLWEARADADAAPVLAAMQSSFRSLPGVLPQTAGGGLSVARRDLVSGLEVRRPIRARSGFFVDAVGSVVTAAEAVAGCTRVTIDEAYIAQVRLVDAALGVAVLSPSEPLVPLAFAQFVRQVPLADSVVRLSGFSFQDTLNRPILTEGRLAEPRGLDGEAELRTLTVAAREGDAGGPVFDGNGAVVGMLLPEMPVPGRMLPADVRFALGSEAILGALERARLRGALSRENATMPPETLTRVSGDLTVLVSCWN